MGQIIFLTWGRDGRLTRLAPVEFLLNVTLIQWDIRRAPIDNHTDRSAVRFTPGSDTKNLAERIWHGNSLAILGGIVKLETAAINADLIPGAEMLQSCSFFIKGMTYATPKRYKNAEGSSQEIQAHCHG
jgi:hypothetical protein